MHNKHDEMQAVNFREIRMGNIAPKTLYRCSHPIKDGKQEKTVSLLASGTHIATVLNLCDTNPEIYKKAFFAPWYNRLLGNGRVIALGMDFQHASVMFRKKLGEGLHFITNTEGPWLIHCHAGIDRTGFFSMVLEALMGATIGEIARDYLLSFNSIFEPGIHREAGKSDLLVVMSLLSIMGNDAAMSDAAITGENITDENVQAIAENYVRSAIKLSAGEVRLLKGKLAGATAGRV